MFINDLSRKKRVAKNEYIYQRGTPVRALYALRCGIAKVYDAQNTLQGVVFPGQVVGADELFASHYQYSVQAATEVEVCQLQNHHFYQISQITQDFTNLIVNILSRAAKEKQQFISVLLKPDGLQKVSGFIHLMADTRQEYGFDHHDFELPLNKKELAQLLGISQSTLARALDTLFKQQAIVVNKKKITLL